MHPKELRAIRRRRGRHDIIMAILGIAKNGVRKTEIMEEANLSFEQLEQYLKALKKADYIAYESSIWKTTEKGLQVIEACKICQLLVKEAQ